jgi:ribokinase
MKHERNEVMAYSVVGVGHAAVDYLGVVEKYPEIDTKIEISEFSMQGGGPVATALVTLARLGISTTCITKISNDDFGSFIQKGLEDSGVDTSGMVVEDSKVSAISFIAVDRKTAKRTIYWTRGNTSPLKPGEIKRELFQNAKVLHVDGIMMDAQIEAARIAKKEGMHVVFDAGTPRDGMEELIPLVDTMIASERFSVEVGSGVMAESLKKLCAMGPKTVVITIGGEGSIGMENNETYVVPAIDIDAVDTTGAGDVYHGAFIYGILNEWKLREKMRFANIAAGLKCRSLGGRAGIPSIDEIKNFN